MAEIDWDALIDANADKAYCFALGLCGNEQDARELVQESFRKAMERIGTHDPSLPFDKWFLTVLKHLYLDGMRRYDRRYGQSLDLPIDASGMTVAETISDAEAPPLDRLEREECAKLVRRAMRRLTPDARSVLLMIDLNGLSYVDAAAAMGCTLNTLRSRIARARFALRQKLIDAEVTG